MSVAPINIGVFHVIELRPFFKRFSHAVNFYIDVATSVAALLFHCRPPTIALAIAKIVVESIKRHSFRTFAHIIKKPGKFVPFVAYRYASPSVVWIKAIVRIGASGFHVCPNSMRPSSVFAMPVKAGVVLFFQAAARFFVAGCKGMAACASGIPAFARTFPCRLLTPDYPVAPYYDKPRKDFANKIGGVVFSAHCGLSPLNKS